MMLPQKRYGMGDLSDYMPDFSTWDWHQWALAGVGAYVVISWVGGGVSRTVRRVKSSSSKKASKRLQAEKLKLKLKELGA
jgi:hypothetical protein